MNKLFYARLAFQNIRRNHRFYYPYLLTGALTVAMFYNMIFTSTNPTIQADSGSLAFLLALGTIIVGLFAVVFILYTNSFLMKRRQKELGLYNLLGMEKRHIGHILLWETVYTCLFTILAGLIIGILSSKLLMLLIFKLLFFTVHYGFMVSGTALIATVLLFAAIYFLAMLHNLRQMKKAKPIDLLNGGDTGEREPRAKGILVAAGILALGAGYFIAIVTKEPIKALLLFFVAVILVMIGTYCLFTAGSIALLKLLKRNKRFYYKTRHFTGVSGMLYRMKQNAVGLANICILSTMVLVTITTTVCMYIGAEDSFNARFPHGVELDVNLNGNIYADTSEFEDDIAQIAENNGLAISNEMTYTYTKISVSHDGSKFCFEDVGPSYGIICVLPAADYESITGVKCNLAPGEVLMCRCNDQAENWESVSFAGKEYRVAGWLTSFPSFGEYTTYAMDAYVIVVPDEQAFNELRGLTSRETPPYALRAIYFDLSGSDEEQRICYREMVELAGDDYTLGTTNADGESDTYYLSSYASRAMSKDEFYSLYGGLLFLGIFLGLLFLMATVLIIYYKQISEGYDDKVRFEIMQKVGMSHAEVRATIRSQILIVFFLPLATAFLHLAMAFPMISRMLLVLGLHNVGLFAICTLITIAVFALVYAAVYAITARTYYKIVEA